MWTWARRGRRVGWLVRWDWVRGRSVRGIVAVFERGVASLESVGFLRLLALADLLIRLKGDGLFKAMWKDWKRENRRLCH